MKLTLQKLVEVVIHDMNIQIVISTGHSKVSKKTGKPVSKKVVMLKGQRKTDFLRTSNQI